MSADETNGVKYTVREMFDRVDKKLDAIDAKLDTKTDTVVTDKIAERLTTLEFLGSKNAQEALEATHEQEKRIMVLETDKVERGALKKLGVFILVTLIPAYIGLAFTLFYHFRH